MAPAPLALEPDATEQPALDVAPGSLPDAANGGVALLLAPATPPLLGAPVSLVAPEESEAPTIE